MGVVSTSSEHDVEAERRGPHVTVIYNGMSREVPFHPNELVDVIRQRAIAAFGVTQNPHMLSLWTEGGSELSDNVTAHEAGVHPNERLQLRPGAVKGGCAR